MIPVRRRSEAAEERCRRGKCGERKLKKRTSGSLESRCAIPPGPFAYAILRWSPPKGAQQMKYRFFVFALVIGAAVPIFGQTHSAVAPENDSARQREVLAAHNERVRALVAADIPALDRIIGDDVIYISPTGNVQTKAQIVSDLKSGLLKVSTADSDDVKVRIYGDAAVVTYRSASKFFDNGQQINGALRATSTYIKRGGRWQLVSHQLTRVISK